MFWSIIHFSPKYEAILGDIAQNIDQSKTVRPTVRQYLWSLILFVTFVAESDEINTQVNLSFIVGA